MEPPSVVLNLEFKADVDGHPFRLSVQVEGKGVLAQRAAVELTAAVTAIANVALPRPEEDSKRPDAAMLAATTAAPATVAPAVTAPAVTAPTAAAPAAASDEAAPAQPQAREATPALAAEAGQPIAARPPVDTSEAALPRRPPADLVAWMQHNRARINLALGAVLLVLAMIIPIIVPAAQRREMLIVTILFGLTSALLLFTAVLPGFNPPSQLVTDALAARAPATHTSTARPPTSAQSKAAPARRGPAQHEWKRREAMRADPRRQMLKAGSGVLIGLAFALAGLFAPFMLGATTADERFVITLGFAPITVVGLFMIAIFWRGLFGPSLALPSSRSNAMRGNAMHGNAMHGNALHRPAASDASGAAEAGAARRPPVARIPDTLRYHALIPAAIAALLIVMVGVVLVVVYATVASVAR